MRTEAIAMALLLSAPAFAEAPKGTKKAPPAHAEKTDDMEAMQKLGAPDEHHEMLDRLVGKWTSQATMTTGPGQEQKSTGAGDNESILGGRFVLQHDTGSFFGQPFEGYGILGYDKLKQKFTWVWQDSMSTQQVLGVGEAAKDGRSIDFTAEEPDWEKGGKTTHKARYVIRFVDDKHYAFEGYDTIGGKEVKVMEIVFTRK